MENLLIIGAAGKKCGKTTLACAIISQCASRDDVYAIKVSTLLPDGRFFDGETPQELTAGTADFSLVEQTVPDETDTGRLLVAGAKRVFWLRAKPEFLKNAFEELLLRLPQNVPIVCESNTLRNFVRPALFFVVTRAGIEPKPSCATVMEFADARISFDGAKFDINLNNISFYAGKWSFAGGNRCSTSMTLL